MEAARKVVNNCLPRSTNGTMADKGNCGHGLALDLKPRWYGALVIYKGSPSLLGSAQGS